MMLGMFLCIYSFSQDYIFMLIDPKGIHYKRRRKEMRKRERINFYFSHLVFHCAY